MHDHRLPAPRKFSLAQQGVGLRLSIALLLVALVWAAILPLVN
jgi:hypothetical protein